MNQTIEDSKAIGIMVGGNTIPSEDGKIEMPPEQAKNTKNIAENIEIGNVQVISVGNTTLHDMNFSKEQIETLKANREARKTAKALARTKATAQR